MVSTYMKKIMNKMLCVTAVYLREIVNTLSLVLHFECESSDSEHNCCYSMLLLQIQGIIAVILHFSCRFRASLLLFCAFVAVAVPDWQCDTADFQDIRESAADTDGAEWTVGP